MINVKHSLKSAVTFIVGATIAIGALSACNTIGGAGKDIKSGGKAIERAADTSK
ncbi:MAG: entericidin A/B family lipoprotein [Rhodospirillaceae bacterium]